MASSGGAVGARPEVEGGAAGDGVQRRSCASSSRGGGRSRRGPPPPRAHLLRDARPRSSGLEDGEDQERSDVGGVGVGDGMDSGKRPTQPR
jgi:hypothetical protein